MGNLVKYAKEELERAGWFDNDSPYDGDIGKAVMELIEVFEKQGHSGLSASIVRSLFNRVSNFKPLTPLTFEDDEWELAFETKEVYQNKRDSAIFKEGKNGRPYTIDAFYMRNEKGETFTGALWLDEKRYVRRCYIKDPANIPTIEIKVKEINGYDFPIDKFQLETLKKYYDLGIVEVKEEDNNED